MARTTKSKQRGPRLTRVEQHLVESALEVRARAYAPYSRFRVGAALLSTQGEVFTACNVESASYGLTVCAERNAVAAAVSAGQQSFKVIAIASDSAPPASPCGACRQVLAEFAPEMKVLLVNTAGDVQRISLPKLLPHRFAGLGREGSR